MFPKLQCPRQPSSLHSRGRMRSKLRNELWPRHWCMTAVPKDGRLLAMTPSSGWDNNPSGRRGGREESFKSRGSAPASNLPTRRAPCWVSSGVCVEPHNVASIRMMGARAGISWDREYCFCGGRESWWLEGKSLLQPLSPLYVREMLGC